MSLIDDFVTAREACAGAQSAADEAANAAFAAQSAADLARAEANQAAEALEQRKAKTGYAEALVALLTRKAELSALDAPTDEETAELAAIEAAL